MTRASRKVASPRVVSVEDLRPLAERRVPRSVFDYLDGGAEGEITGQVLADVVNDTPRSVTPEALKRFEEWGLATARG